MSETIDRVAVLRFCHELAEANRYPLVVPHQDERRWVGIMPLAYTTAIAVGPLFDKDSVTERWCYHTPHAAMDALMEWLTVRHGDGEPEGWHRHPRSGRRRPDGDAAREYVHW
jgi:hypothetical protein